MRNRYSEEFIDYLRKIVPGKTTKEIMDQIKNDGVEEKYGIELTEAKLSNIKFEYRIKSGMRPNAFKKGNIPSNKGVKMSKERYEKCKKTMFKKGQLPAGTREIGEERKQKDGAIYVKVGINEWKPKNRIVWEKNNGPIPEGHIIIFLDGNTENCNIENLAMVSRAENQMLNRRRLRSENPEITKTGINIAKVKMKVIQKRKR